jgi:hypothetical protein
LGISSNRNKLPAEPADRQTQSIDQALVVGLVVEDPRARIADAHDMIDGARIHDSQRPADSSQERKFNHFRVDIGQATGHPDGPDEIGKVVANATH